ncbi:MAG: phosphatase PAP2 family protein [Halobacteriota archaeon]
MVHVHGQQHLHGAYHDRADLAGARKEALVFALVFIITTAIAFGLKYAIARPRPNDLGVTPAAQPAFPSAHTANAFAFATTLSSYHRKFSAVLFAWAALVAFSRLTSVPTTSPTSSVGRLLASR